MTKTFPRPRGVGPRLRAVALRALMVAVLTHAWTPAGAYSITLDSAPINDVVTTFAYDGAGGAVSGTLNPTALPFADVSTSADGGAVSEVVCDFSNGGLRFTITHARSASLGSFAQLVTNVGFTNDVDVDFAASGTYQAVDADGRRILLSASLFDAISGTYVFRQSQESRATPDESFTLGLAEGDFVNETTGPISGTLLAGHFYVLQLNVILHADPTASTASASATGQFALDFFAIGSVPADADRFLTFLNAVSREHAEDENSARAYYAAIDPNDQRLTLGDWLLVNGFDTGATAEATYVNEADLGFGRHMFVKTHPDGRVSSYVINHSDDTPPTPLDPTADPVDGPAEEKIANAHSGTNVVATVAMEYAPPDEDPAGRRFTRFYAYGPDGSRLLTADLDGRGAKAIPGVCNTCHGGSPRPVLRDGRYPGQGDTGAGFLPWDLDSFGFSGTLFGGLPIYSRASQEGALKALNSAVLATAPNDATRELIEGWYGGPGLPNATFDGTFVPPGWTGHESAYREIFAPNCRACHVMRSPALRFRSHSDFVTLQERAKHLVFDRSIMPLARRTYDRFWTGLPGAGSPAFVDLFGVVSPARRPGSGPPLAFAGPDVATAVGRPTPLEGSDSSYAADFSWGVLSAPAGSSAAPGDPTIPSPLFVPDQPGDYLISLVASNASGLALDTVTLSATSDGSDGGVDFETDIFPIFASRCETCHDGSVGPDFLGGATSLALRVQKSYQAFASRASVIDPSESLLLAKATATVSHGGGAALSVPAELDLVRRWIEQGALRDTAPPTYARTSPRLPTAILTSSGIIHPHRGVDLARNASLDGATLADAVLVFADLRDASAIGTDFSGTNLGIANLSGASLAGADLTGTNLTGADVTGTDLIGARYDENTTFPSGNTFSSAPWGLANGLSPWQARMIPVPEPGFGSMLVVGSCCLALARARRRRRVAVSSG